MELRRELEAVPDLAIVYVLPEAQVNEKTRRFVDELGMRERIVFAVDPGSRAIRELGLLRPDPEPIEKGVPHPTTLLVDREGVVRVIDVRTDYHIWLDAGLLRRELEGIP